MKFFSKYKKHIFSVFLCVALFSCFIGFSFSSSADVVNHVQSFSFSNIYLEYADGYTSNGFAAYYTNLQNGTFLFEHNLPYSTPVPLFKSLTFVAQPNYTVPSYSGRALSLSYNVNFTVSDTDYLGDIPSDVDISDSAIFTGARLLIYFTDGSASWFEYDTFLLMDDLTGEVIDPRSDAYWESIKGSPANLSIYALFDVTSVASKTIYQTYLYFPFNDAGNIYYSNRHYVSYLNFTDVSGNIDFAYSPFQDVVQDDLSDIKGSLSGVNNKLDSLNSTMNTIDQDINRVNQKLDQTNETLGNIDQGIQDILKPSTPAVDFKNQWNDYFINNNPIPDMSALPFYDMTSIQTLLIDSSDIVRGIFSPFFLREYVVRIPLTQGFANVELDPVATYVSLSFALSISFILFRLLKGNRG